MIKIKHFIYILIFYHIPFFAMNTKLDTTVKNIGEKINKDLLGITTYTYGESLLSKFFSYYKTLYLPAKKAREEIKTIESYFPQNRDKNQKKRILKDLIKNHWYVYYLIEILVNKKIEKFKIINGSTIDQLLLPQFSDDSTVRAKIIHKKAYHKFFIQEGITSPLAKIPSDTLADTQFILLYADAYPINTSSIIKSCDEQYLRAYDIANNNFTWSLDNGNRVSLSQQETKNITWQPTNYTPHTGLFHLYWISDCYAIHHDLNLMNRYKFPIDIDTDKNALLLYKHPDEKEYLARLAFKNSFFENEEIIKLQNSSSVTTLKDSFSKKQLDKQLQNRIQLLEHPTISKKTLRDS